MICPVCKAEYRQGFTRCADCDVDLVYTIPTTESYRTSPTASPGESDGRSVLLYLARGRFADP